MLLLGTYFASGAGAAPPGPVVPIYSYPYNLAIVNPGAETGATAPWSMVSGAGGAVGSSFAAHSGTYYFVISSSDEYAWFGQTITMTGDILTDIGNGFVECDFSAWTIGFSGDLDSGGVGCEFFDEFDNWIGGKFTALTDPTSWTERPIVDYVPPGTRKIRVSARGRRYTGAQLSNYVDDFACQLVRNDADTISQIFYMGNGSTSGWTVTTGSLATRTHVYGEVVLYGGPNASTAFHRDIGLTGDDLAKAIAGDLNIYASAMHYSFEGDDRGRMYISFLDGSDTVLSTLEESGSPVAAPIEGTPVFLTGAVPATTEKIRLGFTMSRISGTNLDAYYNKINIMLADLT